MYIFKYRNEIFKVKVDFYLFIEYLLDVGL